MGSLKDKKDKPRFRKYDNAHQNELASDDPGVYDKVSKMTIYYDAVKVHSVTVLFDEIDSLERHECYENDPIISGPESSLLSSSEFYICSNVKSMEEQISGLERTSVLYDHCKNGPESNETNGHNSNDKFMTGLTIDPESRETLYFDAVVNIDSSQRHIMIKPETCCRSERPSLINYKVETGVNGNLLPLHDLHKVKPDIDLDCLAHTLNPNVKLEAYTWNKIKQYGQVCL